jgi:glycosyltransferase involved in cell wall biosynthesis
MRLHVLSLPWTVTSAEYCECAYTQKVRKFCRMMSARKHDVTHYGAEGADVDGKHVTVLSAADQRLFFGERDLTKLGSPNWDPSSPAWLAFNGATMAALAPRLKKGDIVCHITGASRPIVRFLQEHSAIHVEYGVGYTGVFCEYRAFESHAVRDAVWYLGKTDPNGRALDYVIPNYWDVSEFPAGAGGDYLLFVGRIVQRKGLATAMEVAKAAGMKLIIAGQGATRQGDALVAHEKSNGVPIVYRGGDWEYRGHVDVAARAQLMGGARAILCPTYYVEPFGGVNVEAQMCSTPAIAFDWGGFTETIEHGRSGYRCMSFDDWVLAVKNAGTLDRRYIRERAIRKYSLETVGVMFDDWLTAVVDHHRGAHQAIRPERSVAQWHRSV